MIPGVPYDAEIEYLQSTGGQHIDLSEWFYGKSFTIEIKWCPLSTTNDRFIFGGGQHSTPLYARLGVYGNYNPFILPNGSSVNIYFGNGNPAPFKNLIKVDKEFIVSGSNYAISAPQVYLFCQEWGSTTNGKIAAKLFYAKFFVNGNLYSDFIPVRIGQTGYMYDRVTKKLFGNKGTGSFVLGPDVAKPVIGLWGMRKFYSTTDYVQDGLTNMWDGIDNIGGGHDMNATVWKDLVGNINLPIEVGGSWESDCLYCDGVNPGVVQRWTVGNGCPYYECVFLLTEVARRTSGRILHIRPYTTSSYEKAVGWGYASGRENSFVVNRRSNVFLDIHRHSVSCASVERNVVEYATLDGHELSFEGNFGAGSFGAGIAIGCSLKSNTPIWQQPVECRVFSIRLYNRALSPDEIAHNYAIDKARFNLP